MPLTLAQLAGSLARLSPGPPARLRRQLRLWTDAGALPLVGDPSVGTGRARLYEDDTPRLAAVAIELARHSYSASDIQYALAWLRWVINRPGYDPADDWYMIVMPGQGGGDLEFAGMPPEQLGDHIKSRDFAAAGTSVLVINLPKLWERLRLALEPGIGA